MFSAYEQRFLHYIHISAKTRPEVFRCAAGSQNHIYQALDSYSNIINMEIVSNDMVRSEINLQ